MGDSVGSAGSPMGDGSSGSRSTKSRKSQKSSGERTAESEPNDMNNTDTTAGGQQLPKRRKKKKSKRRTSSASGVASETDTSDIETGSVKSYSSTTRRKSTSKKTKTKRQSTAAAIEGPNNDDGGIKDSMLISIKNKRKAGGGGGGGGGNPTRSTSRRDSVDKVSFSGSTIVRDNNKTKSNSALDIAMGKIPRPPSDASVTKSTSNDEEDEDESPSRTDSTKSESRGSISALRPSKYGQTSTKKSASFSVDEPQWKVSPDTNDFSSSEDDFNENVPSIRPARRNKPRIREVNLGGTKDQENEEEDDNSLGEDDVFGPSYTPTRKLVPRRSASMSEIETSARHLHQNGPQSMSGDLTGRHRRNTYIDKNPQPFEEKLNGSLTRLRPGIQKRVNIMTEPRLSFCDDDNKDSNTTARSSNVSGGGLHHTDSTGRAFARAKSVVVIHPNQHKQERRMRMSVEDQTYIPPKSRKTSMFQAFTHLMAGRLVDLTLWTYGASFSKVLLFFLTTYVMNIFIWAAVLDAVDLSTGGRCVHEENNFTRSERFELAVELAWATFTTVGYGTVSPQDHPGCYPIRLMCAFVAFVGVLFASTTAAIVYSKLMRLLAQAHVKFSSTLCVQFGKGNEGSTVRFGQLNFRASVATSAMLKFSPEDLLDDDSCKDDDSDEAAGGSEDGFPVIEFRMINDRANHEGSEIWDAQIRGIVQLHKEKPAGEKGGDTSNNGAAGGESTLDLEKKVYYPISLSPDSHPHFSRIWYARHVLNAESPLLKREIRDMIVKEGGQWDKDFNNWKEIRDCLNEFISLRITLSGTSAVSASTVYGEHVYEFDDVCVGWRFANMVYEKKEKRYKNWWRRLGFSHATNKDDDDSFDATGTRTKIDVALLHDIVPQPGGDHEPLNETIGSSSLHFAFGNIT